MRDQNELGRQFTEIGAHCSAGQIGLQPVGEVLQIEEPLAQIGIADLQHASAVLLADLLHRGFCGQAAPHRLDDAVEPATVGREHPVGLDDVAMLAGAESPAGSDQIVDLALHRIHRATQPIEFGGDILGDDLSNHQLGRVQHRRPDRQPLIEANAVEPQRQKRTAVALRHLQRVH